MTFVCYILYIYYSKAVTLENAIIGSLIHTHRNKNYFYFTKAIFKTCEIWTLLFFFPKSTTYISSYCPEHF